ncbi:MAG TPA: LLM class F420-dependent oxidoreductase [Baekduia sp.]
MKFGVPLAAELAELPGLASAAEAAGCESVWVPEHLIWPAVIAPAYPYSESGEPPVALDVPTYDPWVLLGWIAAHTTRIRLGTSVYILPLRDPHVTARAVASLDLVSGGRAVLGVGVGWLAEEFAIAGQDFATRGARTDEAIAILRALWSEAPASYAGRHYAFPPVHFEPKPPQGARLPIVVGGESEPALRRAARLGDGWIGLRHTPESAARVVARLTELRAAAGRGDEPLEVTVGISGSATVEDVARYAEAGVDRVCLRPWRKGEAPLDGLTRLSAMIEEVAG